MAKNIKGVFQLFLQVTDNKKYVDSDIDINDIFLKDTSIKKEISENKKVLKKIDNFELLIECVKIFYIRKNSEQDYFIVGKDTERNEYTVLLIWSSDTSAEKAFINEIDAFNKCAKKIFKKSKELNGRKISIDIRGKEELIIFPAENYGHKDYDQQSIKYIDDSVKWLKIAKTEGKLNDLDKILVVFVIISSIFIIILTFLTNNYGFLTFFGGIVIPMIYEVLRRGAEKKEIKFTFNSFNTENITTNDESNVGSVQDPFFPGKKIQKEYK